MGERARGKSTLHAWEYGHMFLLSLLFALVICVFLDAVAPAGAGSTFFGKKGARLGFRCSVGVEFDFGGRQEAQYPSLALKKFLI